MGGGERTAAHLLGSIVLVTRNSVGSMEACVIGKSAGVLEGVGQTGWPTVSRTCHVGLVSAGVTVWGQDRVTWAPEEWLYFLDSGTEGR